MDPTGVGVERRQGRGDGWETAGGGAKPVPRCAGGHQAVLVLIPGRVARVSGLQTEASGLLSTGSVG